MPEYRRLLEDAGFVVEEEQDLTAEGRAFFERMRAQAAEGPPAALGLHLLFGPAWAERARNNAAALDRGVLGAVALVARAD